MADGAKIAQTVLSGVNSVLGGGWIQGLMQKKENQRQRDYETEFYQMQKGDNLEFWNMQNMYNSPEQQMQRLKSAGLNPNLVYGNGATATTNNAPQSPNQSASNSTKVADINPQLPDLSYLYDFKVKDAQANLYNQQAATQKTNQELNAVSTELKRLEQAKLRTSNEYDRRTINKRIDMLSAQYDQVLTQMANTRSQTRNIDTQRQISIEQNNRQRQTQPYTIEQLKASIRNTEASTQEKMSNVYSTKANTRLTNQKVTTEQLVQKLHQWEIELNKRGTTKNDGLLKRTIAKIWTLVKGGDLDQAYELIENNK